jgi:hypothetical protein
MAVQMMEHQTTIAVRQYVMIGKHPWTAPYKTIEAIRGWILTEAEGGYENAANGMECC